jgi:poly(3-hydroxybutyrate) depolymerase
MKKMYTLIFSILIFLNNLNAQCDNNRFHNFVFSGSTITSNITYGSNVKYDGKSQVLLMDIYEPIGDTASKRPLIIMAHGGSFLGGTKTGTDVVPLCKDLAKLGYVVASIEYRIGMLNFPFMDSAGASAAVLRGVHDGRAAVRFFRKNILSGGNSYKIDINNIYFAGSSAGAFIGLHIAYLDVPSELPGYVDTIKHLGTGGGIEGLSGSPGYPSHVKAVINMCGAISDTACMKNGDIPVLSFHGEKDNTVPFGSAKITVGITPLLKVHGSASVTAKANKVGIVNCFTIYHGQGHVPYISNAALYDTTLTVSRNFLEHFVCGVPLNCNYTTKVITGIESIDQETAAIFVYPNPSHSDVMLDVSNLNDNNIKIEVMDALGRTVKTLQGINDPIITLSKANFSTGIYLLRITSENKQYSKKIIFE